MKTLLKVAIVLLLLPLFSVYALFIYGKYMIYRAEQNSELLNARRQELTGSGNGFGGEAGLEILDSGYFASKKFFWIDNQNLVFRTDYNANAPKDVQRTYVWDTQGNSIKPLILDGSVSCFFDEKLYYAKFSTSKMLPDGRKKVDRFQSEITRLKDRWIVGNSINIDSIWRPPSERHELLWKSECQPWFRIKPALRQDGDVPEHRFTYLSDWGWILRMPLTGPEHWDQISPDMGIFDISGQIYSGQPGEKKADLINIPLPELYGLEVAFIAFLDRIWMANNVYGDPVRKRIMGFIGRDGKFDEVEWPNDWPEYSQVLLPTKKGFFWSGKDYRLENPTVYDKGAFISDVEGRIYKVIVGEVLGNRVSADGCNVAFFNSLRDDDRRSASLKVFNVCKSTIDAKELPDVDY